MRVVQLLPDLNIGGVERGVVELSRMLVAGGVDSVVVSRRGTLSDTITADGGKHVPFNCGGKNPLTLPARVMRLRRLLADLRPDIVHVRSRVPSWLLRFSRRPDDFAVVSTMHGMYSVGWYSAQMTAADKVICPSRAILAAARQHYRVPDEKLCLIPRGIDQAYFSPAAVDEDLCADFRRRYRLDADAAVITIVGRLSRLKGHELFLRAFAKLRAATKPPAKRVIALIVGGGKRLAMLQQCAARLRIDEDVRFVGTQYQVRELYHLSDVLVSASTQAEAFGRTMAEALAMECPVVAAAHGGALDIVQDGGNGLLFPPGDEAALVNAMARALATDWMSLRPSVADFTLAQMSEKTLAIYQQLAPSIR